MSECCCFAIISTSEVGVIEKMGKFDRFEEVNHSSYYHSFDNKVEMIRIPCCN